MFKKRWRVVSTPADHTSELQRRLSEELNASSTRFRFRGSAERMVRFYSHDLKFPLRFWILDEEQLGEPLDVA